MKFHIVRNKETIEDIIYIYNISKDELKEQNKHIRVWDKLIPGTKLRIPPITNAVDLEVLDMEPFVEDYYPAISEVLSNAKIEEEYKLLDEEKGKKEVEEEMQKITEETLQNDVENEKTKSSKIYEDYEEQLKQKYGKLEAKQKEEANKDDKGSPNYYPYYLGGYNLPRYSPYPIIYYPIYYYKKPN